MSFVHRDEDQRRYPEQQFSWLERHSVLSGVLVGQTQQEPYQRIGDVRTSRLQSTISTYCALVAHECKNSKIRRLQEGASVVFSVTDGNSYLVALYRRRLSAEYSSNTLVARGGQNRTLRAFADLATVSYTHLTLPTKA